MEWTYQKELLQGFHPEGGNWREAFELTWRWIAAISARCTCTIGVACTCSAATRRQ